ncbi:MAG TPA: hypothetical protein VGN18_02320 [Jatrophihabitans sp.]|uniref:hypothetical protein n=1 Tax=Jatrophihabitans sp. TaxID=1932789 RepID=UPI002E014CFB|nr:hypothetical protein [Jatrophihabitans sp.]
MDAEEQRMLARLEELPGPSFLETHDEEYVVDEIAAVLRWSPRSAGTRVTTMVDLVKPRSGDSRRDEPR